MATQEQIETVARLLQELHPAPFFQDMNKAKAGIGAVLRLLYLTAGDVTAGDVAEHMGVSTARVAVLLKKMEGKDLIRKIRSDKDARVTIVRLTEKGSAIVKSMQADMHCKVGQVIDQVGMDRVLEFMAIAREIAYIDPRPGADIEECLQE